MASHKSPGAGLKRFPENGFESLVPRLLLFDQPLHCF